MLQKILVGLIVMASLTTGSVQVKAQQKNYRGTFRSVRQLILRIENRTTVFRNGVNAQNRLTANGGVLNLSGLVQNLDGAVDQLRIRFDQRTATTLDAQEVLQRAAEVEAQM